MGVASFPALSETVYVRVKEPAKDVSILTGETTILAETSPSTLSRALAPGSKNVSP